MLDSCTFHSIGDASAATPVVQSGPRPLDFGPALRLHLRLRPGQGPRSAPFRCSITHARLSLFQTARRLGILDGGQNCWMVTHLNYYIRAKLMWDADQNVRELVRIIAIVLWPAAGPVEDYIWTMEKAVDESTIHETFGRLVPWRAIYTPKVMRKLERLMAGAVHNTCAEPAASRVHVLHLSHQYVRAYMAMNMRLHKAISSEA